ncbi:MAG: hypothetical protein ACFFDT_35590 [Candidatus Hodarchaeota archaeon]
MKKSQKIYLFIIIYSSLQFFITPSIVRGNTAFVNSFWNTLGYGEYNVLTDWSEAGSTDFSVSDFTGVLYIKNDFDSLYVGIRIKDEITNNLTWRLNFDVDADNNWAEDAKSLTLKGEPDKLVFSYDDEYYIQNYPQAFPDLQSDNFIASMRNFTSVGQKNTIFELKIPFQTNDHLHDLQVQNPETTIIGLSMDVFYIDTGINGTWRGISYPNYANASNYVHILFAGPQDRKVPVFEEEEKPIQTTTSLTTETELTEPPEYEKVAAASSFEVGLAVLGLFVTVFIVSKFRRRKKA